ncbi:B-cell receptor CD22-like [Sardina pilchardus]|uniref:B-cell receptor CD22-like n=1 Tax=Sardina pilchardus TaxID=27697 RepID=UPI002E0FAF63
MYLYPQYGTQVIHVCAFTLGSLDSWGVNYATQSKCAPLGSTVDIGCSYTYPSYYTIKSTIWMKYDTSLDLGRHHFMYLGDRQNNCTLRIKYLSYGDTGEYKFRFETYANGWTAESAFMLYVTALWVVMSPAPVREGQNVTLTCSTTCPPHTNPTYIWYRNTQRVTGRRMTDSMLMLKPVSSGDSGSYSCAVKGHEAHPSPEVTLSVQYGPRNISATDSSSGYIVEGDSVTLTCSSDANPPVHTYTWYRKTGDKTAQVATGQNYSITNTSTQASGPYYCQAENEVGRKHSSDLLVNVYYAPRNTSASVSPSGNMTEGSSVNFTCSSDANPPVSDYTWYKSSGNETVLRGTGPHLKLTLASGDGGVYHCQALNEVGSQNSTGVEVIITGGTAQQILVFLLIAVAVALAVVLTLVIGIVCCRKKRTSTEVTRRTSDDGQMRLLREGMQDTEEDDSTHVYDEISAAARTSDQVISGGDPVDSGDLLDSGGDPVDSGGVLVDSGGDPVDSGGDPVDSGDLLDSGGDPVDSGGVLVDSGGDPVDSGGDQVDSGGDPVDSRGDLVDLGGDPVDSGGDQVDSGGDPVDSGGDLVDFGRDPMDSGGDRVDSGDPVYSGGDQVDSGDEDDVHYASVQFKAKNKDTAQDTLAVQPRKDEEQEKDVEYATVKFSSRSSAANM